MVGLIVKVEEDRREDLVRELSGRSHASIHGVEGNQIALLLDTDDIHIIAGSTSEIQDMKGVIGVYPIFSKDIFSP